MDDDLMLLTGLDQPLPADNGWILDKVDEIFKQSLTEKNPYIALNACKQLLDIGKLSGLALAKFFYLIKSNWDNYEQAESFEDVAYTYLGRHKHTVERYVKVWKMFAENIIPEDYKEEMQQRNIKELIPIGNAIDQGYDFTEEDWDEIVDAPDLTSVSRVVRDVKGQPPRKGSLQLVMDKIGTLLVYVDNERFFVGSLEVNDDEEVVQKAINRIIKNSGIIQND